MKTNMDFRVDSKDKILIFIDRLKDGKEQKIEEELSPEFFDIDESALRIDSSAKLTGRAYVACSHLIVQFKVSANFILPCSFCNEDAIVSVEVKDGDHAEDISNIRSKVFDLSPVVREVTLLEVPPFAECQWGNCPNRGEIEEYLVDPGKVFGIRKFTDFCSVLENLGRDQPR